MSCLIQQIISRIKPWISKYYNSIQLYKFIYVFMYVCMYVLQQGTVEDSGGLLNLCYQGASEIIGRLKFKYRDKM